MTEVQGRGNFLETGDFACFSERELRPLFVRMRKSRALIERTRESRKERVASYALRDRLFREDFFPLLGVTLLVAD